MRLKHSSTSSRCAALLVQQLSKRNGELVHVSALGVSCASQPRSLRDQNIAGLSGFALFVSVAGIFFSLFMLLTPVIYEKYDKGARLARALKELRVGFILCATGVTVSLLIS